MKVSTRVWVEIALEVEGTYVREVPERGPTYSCGGEPAEPAHFEDVEIVGMVTELREYDPAKGWTLSGPITIDADDYHTAGIYAKLEKLFADQIQQALLDEVTS